MAIKCFIACFLEVFILAYGVFGYVKFVKVLIEYRRRNYPHDRNPRVQDIKLIMKELQTIPDKGEKEHGINDNDINNYPENSPYRIIQKARKEGSQKSEKNNDEFAYHGVEEANDKIKENVHLVIKKEGRTGDPKDKKSPTNGPEELLIKKDNSIINEKFPSSENKDL